MFCTIEYGFARSGTVYINCDIGSALVRSSRPKSMDNSLKTRVVENVLGLREHSRSCDIWR